MSIAHTITRVDQVGVVDRDSNGYPWKCLRVTDDRNVELLPEGSPVYGEYQ